MIMRNKLTPSVLCHMLAPTLGECTDGGLHETIFDEDDLQRMNNIIKQYYNIESKLDKETLLNQLTNTEKFIMEWTKENEIRNPK